MTTRWFLNANEGCIMTPRFLVEAVEVSMLSTKWLLWTGLALSGATTNPGLGQQWGRGFATLVVSHQAHGSKGVPR